MVHTSGQATLEEMRAKVQSGMPREEFFWMLDELAEDGLRLRLPVASKDIIAIPVAEGGELLAFINERPTYVEYQGATFIDLAPEESHQTNQDSHRLPGPGVGDAPRARRPLRPSFRGSSDPPSTSRAAVVGAASRVLVESWQFTPITRLQDPGIKQSAYILEVAAAAAIQCVCRIAAEGSKEDGEVPRPLRIFQRVHLEVPRLVLVRGQCI